LTRVKRRRSVNLHSKGPSHRGRSLPTLAASSRAASPGRPPRTSCPPGPGPEPPCALAVLLATAPAPPAPRPSSESRRQLSAPRKPGETAESAGAGPERGQVAAQGRGRVVDGKNGVKQPHYSLNNVLVNLPVGSWSTTSTSGSPPPEWRVAQRHGQQQCQPEWSPGRHVDLTGEVVKVHMHLVEPDAFTGKPTSQSTPIVPPRHEGRGRGWSRLRESTWSALVHWQNSHDRT
jgi:hypothetical protein